MSSKRPRASLVDRVFDRKYRDSLNRATREVPLLHLLYLTCIPLSKACVRLRLSPTMISHGSNALAMLAVAALAWSDKPWLFPLLWIAALYLDIADGIVARVTNTATASGSFYDHMSDQVKVILVFLAAGLRYESTNVWILSFLVSAGFLFMNLVNQILALRTLRLSGPQIKCPISRRARSRNRRRDFVHVFAPLCASTPECETYWSAHMPVSSPCTAIRCFSCCRWDWARCGRSQR